MIITYLELLQMVADGKPPKKIKAYSWSEFEWEDDINVYARTDNRFKGQHLSEFLSKITDGCLANNGIIEVIEE